MMVDDEYWSQIIPQSRYRKIDEDGDVRSLPMDVEAWTANDESDKQRLRERVDALYTVILNELMGDHTDRVDSTNILNSIKRKLGV